jgi:hypothetical protein
MANNNLIIAGVLIAVIVVGALAATTLMNNNGTPVNAVTAGATKLTFQNNGTTWLHLDVIFENATLKNGTNQTFYGRMYLKPNNGTAIIDLSNILGYGDQKLPAGTSIRILAWKGLFMPTAGGTNALNLNMQGWSGTLNPVDGDALYNMFYQPLSIFQLPSINGTQISNDTWAVKTDLNELNKLVPLAADNHKPVFEEEILKVDQNGKVTMIIVQAPSIPTVTQFGVTKPVTPIPRQKKPELCTLFT